MSRGFGRPRNHVVFAHRQRPRVVFGVPIQFSPVLFGRFTVRIDSQSLQAHVEKGVGEGVSDEVIPIGNGEFLSVIINLFREPNGLPRGCWNRFHLSSREFQGSKEPFLSRSMELHMAFDDGHGPPLLSPTVLRSRLSNLQTKACLMT